MKRKMSTEPPKAPVQQPKSEEPEVGMIPLEVLQAILSGGMSKEEDSLEERGVLFLDKEVSNYTITHIIKRMMSLHFDPDFKDPIQLIINSPGGNTDAGWALIDVMSWVKNPVRTIALGSICSMATSIFISGDDRIMGPNTIAMIHQFSWGNQGNYSDLVAQRKAEDLQDQMDVKHLAQHSKYRTEAEVRKHLLRQTDTWLSPMEMKKHGLCDRILQTRRPEKKKKK